jgi:prolyl-tRNA editing enzyme YbaK/EbsC (Cys-tRNA(Pro) deacylase)
MDQPPASLALEGLGIPHRVFYHQGNVTSLEQAARERSQIPEQVVRSILFRLGKDDYLMVLVAGPIQIPWKALRKHVGQSRLTLASEEEVLAVTGFRIGTVSPFGLPRPIRVILEAGVLKQDEISIGSGLPNTGIIIKSADLQAALGEVVVVRLIE